MIDLGFLSPVKDMAVLAASRGGFAISKMSPQLLLGIGLASLGVAGVTACVQTLKVNQVMSESQNDFDKITKAHEAGVTESGLAYSETDWRKDIAIANVQRAVNLGRLYAVPIGLTVVGVTAILASHGILMQRNTALAAAYAVMERGYSNYRKTVVKELGVEQDAHLASTIYDEQDVKIESSDEIKPAHYAKSVTKFTGLPPYAKWFGPDNKWYQLNSPHDMMYWMQCQQSWANNYMRAHGHLFLNDMYRVMGFDPTPEGQLMGWQYSPDKVIDFGMDPDNYTWDPFRNGERDTLMITFNVDPEPLYYKI